MIDLVAHRAGNHPDQVAPAAGIADAVEFDVHRFHGRLEVRHAKVVWPTGMQWDKWWFDPRPATPPTLHESLARLPTGSTAWFDLKGFDTRLTIVALAALAPGHDVVVSTRNWWILRPARRRGVRVMRSVGSRTQLLVLALVSHRHPGDGIAISERLARPEVLRRLRRRTDDIVVWGVHDLDRAIELALAGVRGLILDDLELLGTIRRWAECDR